MATEFEINNDEIDKFIDSFGDLDQFTELEPMFVPMSQMSETFDIGDHSPSNLSPEASDLLFGKSKGPTPRKFFFCHKCKAPLMSTWYMIEYRTEDNWKFNRSVCSGCASRITILRQYR